MSMERELTLVSNWKVPRATSSATRFGAYRKQVRDFVYTLFGAAQEYTSPIPLVFACGVRDLRQLERSPQWLVRDGIVPLLKFFETFPSPPRWLKTRLYVDRDLALWVPEPWRKQTELYRVVKLRSAKRSEPARGVFLAGILSSRFLTREAFSDALAAVEFEREPQGEIHFCAPIPHVWGEPDDGEFVYAAISSLYTRFPGARIRRMSLAGFRNRLDFSGFSAIELNSKLMVADSAMLHHLLSLHADFGVTDSDRPGTRLVPLSASHGWEISREFPEDSAGSRPELETLGLADFDYYFPD